MRQSSGDCVQRSPHASIVTPQTFKKPAPQGSSSTRVLTLLRQNMICRDSLSVLSQPSTTCTTWRPFSPPPGVVPAITWTVDLAVGRRSCPLPRFDASPLQHVRGGGGECKTGGNQKKICATHSVWLRVRQGAGFRAWGPPSVSLRASPSNAHAACAGHVRLGAVLPPSCSGGRRRS